MFPPKNQATKLESEFSQHRSDQDEPMITRIAGCLIGDITNVLITENFET